MTTTAQQIAEVWVESIIAAYLWQERGYMKGLSPVETILDLGLQEAVSICEVTPKEVSDPGMIGLAEMILTALKGEKP